MKKILTIAVCIVGSISILSAQETFKKSLNGINKVSVEVNTSITVEQASGNDLEIEWSGSKRKNKTHEDEKAEGLTALYSRGNDNTGFGLNVEKDGEVLRIRDLKSFLNRKSFTLKVPRGIDLDINTGALGGLNVNGFENELEVTSNVGGIHLTNVTGPITASTSTGRIEIIFNSVNQSAPISLSTATAPIDVTMPANTNASVEMSSTMGTVFSNFDLVKPRQDGLKNISGNRKIEGDINKGGVKVYLSSATGNIYLRTDN